jgi:hypothetical protein
MARTYGSTSAERRVVVAMQPKESAPDVPTIDAQTKTVSVSECSRLLQSERGLTLSIQTIRRHCSTGKWRQGQHWVKPGRDYLINMAAVYAWIAQ